MSSKKALNFMGARIPATALSVIFLVVAIGALAVNGLKLGLDFTGGAQVEVSFSQPADIPKIRSILNEQGLKNPVAVLFGSDTEVLIRTQGAMSEGAENALQTRLTAQYGDAQLVAVNRAPSGVSGYSQELLISGVSPGELNTNELFPPRFYGQVELSASEQGVSALIENNLDSAYTQVLLEVLAEQTQSAVELRRSEYVGPQIGAELRDEGGIGMLVALVVVMLYVAVRFQYKFSVGAVLALAHDVIIVLGFFALMRIDFDLTVLAAVLAVIGYSLNDTIVVFDRIRENFRIMRKGSTTDVINASLTQTLERTFITSLTTLLVLGMLFVFGGELISGFAIALIVGVVVGTYSSIYVSANTLMWLKLDKEDLMPPEKEGAEIDQMP
ncbi:protein translocase subunit SecF [Gilvimarinus agarilyticus]|uniref:protein translocase subunit SecF n=1 Tax=unclassified Gilvimarinus TaxID=2642066 RepID=UPI001C09F1CD|nr:MULTISPECIES: protein translocase subunit SecF [unclassified Gilvimarinus]MBU2887321.1 protein translocase subunit SecF [Gilvimarinus agarilyticus]MDO6571980.1 protein translocase subunit SecF [Gilvimarinus sp. 2_MG-2023]MDO6746048.1 protein translocase subunit SecF [Gilvimarinus sp. 1_MG-2023]